MKKLPTKLKILKGTYQKERENPNEPEYKIEIPDPPKFLMPKAKKEWKRISEVLYNQGLITGIDMACLAAYCQFYARWVNAEIDLKKSGKMLIKTTSGNIINNPYIGIANTAFKNMHTCLLEFGMTPSSRGRVSAKTEKDKKDPWDKFMTK